MAQVAMIAGLGMMCLSSSVGAALMMGGSGEEDSGGGGGAGAGAGPILPKGRYVRFTFHEGAPSKYILAPKEIKVFDKQGVNVALTKPVEAHGHHNAKRSPKENAVDGDEDTIWHSKHGSDTDWIEVDLEEEVEISKIVITQGTATTVHNGVESWARMSGGGPDSTDKGSYIIIKDAAMTEVKKTEDIKTVAAEYTYDFTKEDGTWA
jgi:hypothetical protein